MSVLFFVINYAEMQRKQGVLVMGWEVKLAKKNKYPHMLPTLTHGLKTQESEYLFEKPRSASLVC